MMNLPPADWKHIQAQIAAASKQSMHAGTHFTDLGRLKVTVFFISLCFNMVSFRGKKSLGHA